VRVRSRSVLRKVLEVTIKGRRRLNRRRWLLIFLRMMTALLLPHRCLALKDSRSLSRISLLLLTGHRVPLLRDTRPLCREPSTLVLPKVLALTRPMGRMSSVM